MYIEFIYLLFRLLIYQTQNFLQIVLVHIKTLHLIPNLACVSILNSYRSRPFFLKKNTLSILSMQNPNLQNLLTNAHCLSLKEHKFLQSSAHAPLGISCTYFPVYGFLNVIIAHKDFFSHLGKCTTGRFQIKKKRVQSTTRTGKT